MLFVRCQANGGSVSPLFITPLLRFKIQQTVAVFYSTIKAFNTTDFTESQTGIMYTFPL